MSKSWEQQVQDYACWLCERDGHNPYQEFVEYERSSYDCDEHIYYRWQDYELEASYPEKAKGVTEPVLAFVRTIRQNPKRFKLKQVDRGYYSYGFDYWNFKDKENGKEWNFTTYQSFNSAVIIQGLPSWLTEEEKQYLHKEFKDIFKESRRKKLHQIQRERMKRLYK